MTAPAAGTPNVEIHGTPYLYDRRIEGDLNELMNRVQDMRRVGRLSGESLRRLRKFFRIKNIYHSNAIEGNTLDLGETQLVVEEGLTISGKPLKDTLEAKNLAGALDLLEQLVESCQQPIREVEIRQIHQAVLSGIDDENPGRYRTAVVEISGSKFRPPGPESIAPEMNSFCAWLKEAASTKTTANPVLVASAAHAWFVTIHPFLDGNGRTARLLMNLILMRFGFPIAVITREDRHRYYEALEESQVGDLTPFIRMISESVEESIEQYELAAAEQREHIEWAQSLARKFGAEERDRVRADYELWKNGLDLVKSYFRQTAGAITEAALGTARVYFRDFGHLEFEKFLSMRSGHTTKKIWFFRLDFLSASKTSRYLFFFGFPSQAMKEWKADVTLHISFESSPFFYERMDMTRLPNKPDLAEIGFQAPETFLHRNRSGRVQQGRLEDICRQFFGQVAEREF